MGVCLGVTGGSSAIEIVGTGNASTGIGSALGEELDVDGEGVVIVVVVVTIVELNSGVAVFAVSLLVAGACAGNSDGLGGSGWLAASAINSVALAALSALPLAVLVVLSNKPKKPLPSDADCAGVPGRLVFGLELTLCPWFPRRIRSTNEGRARSVGRNPSMQQ